MGACVQDRGEVLALELKFLQAGFISMFIPQVIVYAAHEIFEEVNDMIKEKGAAQGIDFKAFTGFIMDDCD